MTNVYAPYTIFGRTIDVPVITYTDSRRDNPPKKTWDREMWIEREEDWYGLPHKGTVRVVEREMYLKERAKYPDDVFKVAKNPYNNVSDVDFATWQRERAKDKARIQELERQVSEMKEEAAYWCRVAVQRP